MAAAAFSIRGFAASKRTEQAAEGRRPLGMKALPPIEAPRFRWWADELASAVAAGPSPSPRRSPKAKPPKKKRSISDLFAAAPPLAEPPSDDEQTEAEDDEALLAIVRRAKEEKKRKRRLQEEEGEDEAAASADGSGGREAEGNFETRKEALENPNMADGFATKPSQKPEASQHLRKEIENISRKRKQEKIHNTMKKPDTDKCIDSNKADKVRKPRDMEKHLPRQSILKIKRTSVKMVKAKRGNSKGKKVIELCRKSVKRVKFSEADNILGSDMQSCELPKRRSLSKLFSDALASSSSSSSSSASTEGDKCITTDNSSFHMPKEVVTKTKEANLCSNHEDSSTEGNKCIIAESCSSHIPEEAITKSKEANLNSNHEDSPKPSNTELSLHLLDLNEEAVPETTDLNYTYNSNSEVPYLPDGREHWRNLSFESHRLANQLPAADSGSVRNTSSGGTLLRAEQAEVSGIDIVGPPLSLRELGETHRDCGNVSVKDTLTTSMSPCALSDHTFQGSFQQHQNVFHTNLNYGGSQLSTRGKFTPLSLRELGETHRDRSNVSVKDATAMSMSPCALPGHTFQDSIQQHQSGFRTNLNHGGSQLSTGGRLPFWSSRELNIQRDCSPSMGQTLRLMGKDLAVCTTRGETSAVTRQKHTGTSTNDYGKTNAVLELPRQGQPFLSLQHQSFPGVTLNPTGTIHSSRYHSSTSQAHLGYRTPNDFSHPIPAANLFSGDRSPYENRFGNFPNSQPSQPFLLGCPPLPNNRSAAPHQNSPAPWRYYADPVNRTESPRASFWPTTRQHGTPSSVFHGSLPQHGTQSSVLHGSLPQQHIVHPPSSSARPLNYVNSTFSHPTRVVQEASNSIRDAAHSSRNSENRMGSDVPGSSNASSVGRYPQKRSGPVKLTPGAKHILVPNDTTGDGNSLPVYSCVSFGSRSANASASQNKGA
ncbi:uncharacterized protein LOC124660966 [Lolium rigidum]|uniref:uncharacterized protein LOC124660966 n=1 Tax=Lolium rigidum TaxID=89674 RepID=UPI001F5D7D9C|nr:uncharacterized protein LOC124660966 [Lolium rigidum]